MLWNIASLDSICDTSFLFSHGMAEVRKVKGNEVNYDCL